MKTKIESITEVKKLVDVFYEKVRQDQVLSPIFNEIIQDQWPEHLAKMYRFWQTVLLNEHTYKGAPFLPHQKMDLGGKHFNLWLQLFNETLDENFEGETAEEARWRASKMAEMFEIKINFHKKNNTKPLF